MGWRFEADNHINALLLQGVKLNSITDNFITLPHEIKIAVRDCKF